MEIFKSHFLKDLWLTLTMYDLIMKTYSYNLNFKHPPRAHWGLSDLAQGLYTYKNCVHFKCLLKPLE